METGGDSIRAWDHTGRGSVGGTKKSWGLERVIRRPGLKVWAADGQRDPGNIEAE